MKMYVFVVSLLVRSIVRRKDSYGLKKFGYSNIIWSYVFVVVH